VNDTGVRRSGPVRWGLVAAVAVVLVLAWAPPASAHASLVDTNPDEGAVLAAAPDVVRLTFSEPVRGVPNGVQVFDAEGAPIASSSRTVDTDLLVTLDQEVGKGTVVVAWRVVSVDGHPIAGTLTFAVGAPSPAVATPDLDASEDDVPVALSLSRWPAYAGLLLTVGIVWFATLLLPGGTEKLDRAWRRLRQAARGAAGVAVVAWLVGVPLTALYLRGTGPGTLLDGATWRSLPAQEAAITAVVVIGVGSAAWLLPPTPGRSTRHLLAAVVGLLALAALPLSGHTRAEPDTELVVTVDWLHLVAGSVWLGGLVGLALTLPGLAGRREVGATLLSRFSTAAASVLAVLVLSGAFLAWRIVGSWDALVSDGYGQLLLVKISFAAVAAAIAAYNRLRLLPRFTGAAGFHDRVATARSLSRTTSLEAATLVAVLLVTGFLVNKSPPPEELATPATPAGAAQTVRTGLGDLEAVITLSPTTTGMNTVTLRLADAAGEPAAGIEPPRVRIASGRLAGDVPLVRIEPGTYQGRVVLPSDGIWQVRVSLRLSRFDNPVASVEFKVGEGG
jgi:copper transport protein